MLESSVLDYHTSQNNTYIYSCTTLSVTQIDTEFVRYVFDPICTRWSWYSGFEAFFFFLPPGSRLKTWICDMENVKCKQELSQLLFPIFCHLYLDTLSESNGQHCQAAMIFFKRHQSTFTSESLRDLIKDIGNVFKKDEIEHKPLVKAFR